MMDTCPTCGHDVWQYEPGLWRCPNGHMSRLGDPEIHGRTLTAYGPDEPVSHLEPVETLVPLAIFIAALLAALLAGIAVGWLILPLL